MIVEVHGIPVWTRVRFPPGPCFVMRRDPPQVGGVLMTNCGKEGPSEAGRIPYHAGRRPRTKFVYYGVCYFYIVVRRDLAKLGGFLITQADAHERSSTLNASALRKLNKSNSVYDIIVYRNICCLVYQWK